MNLRNTIMDSNFEIHWVYGWKKTEKYCSYIKENIGYIEGDLFPEWRCQDFDKQIIGRFVVEVMVET